MNGSFVEVVSKSISRESRHLLDFAFIIEAQWKGGISTAWVPFRTVALIFFTQVRGIGPSSFQFYWLCPFLKAISPPAEFSSIAQQVQQYAWHAPCFAPIPEITTWTHSLWESSPIISAASIPYQLIQSPAISWPKVWQGWLPVTSTIPTRKGFPMFFAIEKFYDDRVARGSC